MIKRVEFASEVFKASKKSQLIYRQNLLFPSSPSTLETRYKVHFLNKINIFLAKRNLNRRVTSPKKPRSAPTTY